ncbi:MAG: ABC transporter permease [Acidimicrobiales bacterium]
MIGRAFRISWYHFRAAFHQRWSGYLTVIILIGLVGGVAMGAVAAARRTQSAFPAYLAASHSSDLQFQVYSSQSVASLDYLTKELEHLPQVARVAIAPTLFVTPIGANGRALPTSLSSDEITTIGSVGGEYFTQDQVAVTAGRMANPKNTHEMVATAQTAKLAGWHLGETVKMGDFTVAQINSGVNPATAKPALKFSTQLVGLVVFSNQVASDDIDRYSTYQLLTPALTQKLQAGATYPNYGLRLRDGSRDVAAVEREIARLVPKATPYAFLVTSVTEGRVERSSKPEAIALGVFGAIAALAALLIAGQAISRALWADGEDLNVLRALGADSLTVTSDAVFGLLGAVVLGATLAVVLAVALSPLAPLGPARQVERTPGFALDWTVLGAGFAVLGVGLSALTVTLAYRRAVRRRIGQGSEPVQRGSAVVNAAARYGFPAPVIAGLRFSLEAGHGRSAVPVRSVLVGSVLAVTVVVVTVTFASGLNTLVFHPALYGWNWNFAIEPEGGDNVPPMVGRLLNHDPDVAAWTGFGFADVQIDGQTVPTLVNSTHAALSPPILSGHAIQAKNQIVLGAATLAALHTKIGQSVVVSYGSPKDAPIYQPPTHLVVVGTATMPAIGNAGTLHPSMGTGALFSEAIFVPALARALVHADPNLNGPAIDVVRIRSGVTPTAALFSLHRIADAANKAVANDPQAYGDSLVVLGVQRPAEIVNYQSTGASPGILAAGLAVGAVVALGLTLGASARRRRRDIALLKTLGFTRRQLAVAVAWQASVAAIVGIVVGVPAGIALGRWLWDLFARSIYAVPLPTVPVLEVVLVALGALVLANLVAALPGQMAARTPTALILRAE